MEMALPNTVNGHSPGATRNGSWISCCELDSRVSSILPGNNGRNGTVAGGRAAGRSG